MLLERLKEVNWKTVSLIAVPLLIITFAIAFLLVCEPEVSTDALRKAQYSEGVRNVSITAPSPSQAVGDHAIVSTQPKVEEMPETKPGELDPNAEGVETVTAGEKLSETDEEYIIDPHEGETVPEGEKETSESEVTYTDESETAPTTEAVNTRGEQLAGTYVIADSTGTYTVTFYNAESFLASGRYAAEEEADFSIDALEQLIEEAGEHDLNQYGFIDGQDHTGAYTTYTYDEQAHPRFLAYITNGDTVAVIEGNLEEPGSGFRPNFVSSFNLTK